MVIKIGGIDIDVEYIPMSRMDCYGQYITAESRIMIANELSESQKKATLIHELLEAINHIYHVNLKHDQIEKLEVGLNSSGLIKLPDFGHPEL